VNSVPAAASGTINTQANMFTYLFGPQFNLAIHKTRLFGETLFGAAYTNGYADFFKADGLTSLQPSNNGFAMAIGGGIDYQVAEYVALRPAQLDYFLTRYEMETNRHQQSEQFPVPGWSNISVLSQVFYCLIHGGDAPTLLARDKQACTGRSYGLILVGKPCGAFDVSPCPSIGSPDQSAEASD
jgi:hypothetical protein